MGRKKGSRNKGYWFRSGRGWFCGSVAMLDEEGRPLRDRNATQAAERAYARLLLGQPGNANGNGSITVLEATDRYLSYCQANNAPATYTMRLATLRSLCEAYGGRLVSDLRRGDLDEWLASKPRWKGSRRTHVKAVLRALNYCQEAGYVAANPLRGYKVPPTNKRVTYLTPEQEEACYAIAKPAVATAIRVCIRTGARYGCEFAALTDRHVTFTVRGMEWRFPKGKTRRLRVIRVTDPAIIALCQGARGYVFRNTRGEPWKQHALGDAFHSLKKKLAQNGVALDSQACMYSTRHTYAKRSLSGYWTGKPCTIEQLAELMGNSPKVCWEHYASWCESYTDPLWERA